MRVTRFHADEPFDHYRHTLEKLGTAKGLRGLILGKRETIAGKRKAVAQRHAF